MTVVDRLLDWYARSARKLPWRMRSDPYAIWVSEVMLQQTRVEVVIPYFEAFMRRFPDVGALAAARLEAVLKAWEGLGYYARARNLHRAARVIVEKHGGRFPTDMDGLSRLPGIGNYTAAALSAIAFGEDQLALDGNLRRVLTRLYDLHLDPRSPSGERSLRELGESLLPPGRAAEFNQALMDLGALICTPRSPDCINCPIQRFCLAYRRGTQQELPVRVPRTALTTRHAVAGIWSRGDQVLIRQQPEQGLLGAMWGFPGGYLDPGESQTEALRRHFSLQLGVEIGSASPLPEMQHSYTHFKVCLHPYLCRSRSRRRAIRDARWVTSGELDQYPMGKLDRQLAEFVRDGAQ